MEENEIINKVANSSLITIDLEEFYPEGKRILFDLKDWLYEGLILREKDFRQALKTNDWMQYQDTFVAIICSSDAILPAWSTLLVSTYLQPYAKKVVVGNLEQLETALYQNIIDNLSIEEFKNGKIIIKGCSNKPVPESAYLQLIERLFPIANSLMYGEACSTVPLFKKKKK